MKSRLARRIARVCCGAAAAAALVLATPSLAVANPTSGTDVPDSTVTITGLLNGDTVSAYLIADADIDAANNLTYIMAPGLPEAFNTIDELSAVVSDGTNFVERSAMQNAAAAIANNLGNAAVTAQANGNSAALTLGSGYYLIRVTSTNGDTRVYQNMIVDVSPTPAGATYTPHQGQTLAVKMTEVSVTKTVGDNDAESTDKYGIGDEVPFKIVTALPNYPTDAANATFVITDDLGAGLELRADSVLIGGQPAATGAAYTISTTGNQLKITYNRDYVLAHPGEQVTVTYKAAITADAFSNATGVTANNAKITFNPNPYDGGTKEPSDSTTVKTYGYYFKKTQPDGTPLPGATFTITLNNGQVLTSQSDQDGWVYFEDLAAGQYTATETVVPSGYRKAPDQQFTLSADTATSDNPATGTITENNYLAGPSVIDPKQPLLPTTGAGGVLVLVGGGTALIVGGIVLFVLPKRRSRS